MHREHSHGGQFESQKVAAYQREVISVAERLLKASMKNRVYLYCHELAAPAQKLAGERSLARTDLYNKIVSGDGRVRNYTSGECSPT